MSGKVRWKEHNESLEGHGNEFVHEPYALTLYIPSLVLSLLLSPENSVHSS